MDKVIAADAVAVAVAAGADDFEFVIGKLRARRNGERAAMQGVHPVGVHVAGQVRRAADAAHDEHLVRLETQFGEGGLERRDDREVAAAGLKSSTFHLLQY